MIRKRIRYCPCQWEFLLDSSIEDCREESPLVPGRTDQTASNRIFPLTQRIEGMSKYLFALATTVALASCDGGPSFKVSRTQIAESSYIKVQSTTQGVVQIKQIVVNQRPQCVLNMVGPSPMSFGDVIHATLHFLCRDVAQVDIVTDHGTSTYSF